MVYDFKTDFKIVVGKMLYGYVGFVVYNVCLRLRRYFTPRAGGQLKCTPEALAMWKTPSGRVSAIVPFLILK